MRKIDQKITQAQDPEVLLWHLQKTLNVAHTEAKLAFQRQLENYEILANRIQQIRDAFPKHAYGLETTTTDPGHPPLHEARRPKKVRGPRKPPLLRG
jgi:hypothetical protein